MATLQKIRNRGPLLIIVIGLALLAFIAGDAWKILRPNQGMVMVGEINGKSVSAMDFQDEVEKYAEVVKFSMGVNNLSDEQYTAVKDEVWNTMVRKSLFEKECSAIGLRVTDAEVQAVIESGQSAVLSQTPFTNANGEFDVDYLTSFLVSYNSMERDAMPAEYMEYYDNMYNFWLYIEDNIKTSLLYSKYLSLVQGSVVTNPVSLKNSYENRIRRSDILLAAIPYTALADTLVSVSSADVKKMYNEKKELFNQLAESRDINYIDVEILPSQADRDEVLSEVSASAEQLAETTEDLAAFIRLAESSVLFSEVPTTREALPLDVAVRLDSVAVGEVFGPYYNASDDSYNAFKILSTVSAYDSICFHRMQVVAEDEAATAQLADSIFKAIKAGADFEEIAQKYSQSGAEEWISSVMYEGGAYSGNDALYLNTLMGMKKGDVVNLALDGATLIMKVTDVKKPVTKYNTAIIKREVLFSNETSNVAYDKLSQFVAGNTTIQDLKNNAEENGYRVYTINDFQSNSYNVADVAKSHEALRWLFEAKEGEVSRIYEVGENNDHLLVVALNKIHKKGYRPVEDMQAQLMPQLINDKKAEILTKRMASASSIQELRSVEGVQVDTVKFVNFTTPAFVSMTYSNEPLIGAAVYHLDREHLSAPIKGSGGVFVAEKISPDNHSTEFEASAEAERVKAIESRNISNTLIQELFYKASVVDNRYKTF
ncbi:MAG: SurA N-terminal domain-containing protein [Bacteroidaceae bacterium]|nr:SurA N-terminal domain-containing protein [Bacteroidaceae bacterium]